MIANYPVDAGDDRGGSSTALAIKNPNGYESDRIGDSVIFASNCSGNVGPVAMAVGGSVGVVNGCEPSDEAITEFDMVSDTRVDDVCSDTSTI